MVSTGSPLARLASAMALGSLTACAPRGDAMRRELEELRRDVAALRSDNAALHQRLDALETEPPTASPASSGRAPTAAAGPASAPTGDRPELRVVKLSPEETSAGGWVTIDPSDPGQPRPAARPGDGPPTEIRSERGGVVVQRPTSPPVTSARPAAPAPPRK